MKIFKLLLSLSLLLNIQANDNIKEIKSFNEISDRLLNSDQNSFVVFDIVGTLIKPLKSDFISQIKPGYLKKQINYFDDIELSKKMLDEKRELTETIVIEIINTLLKKNIKVIALTKCKVGSFEMIKNLQLWRYDQLQNLGIDFNESLKIDEMQLNNFSVYNGTKPIFFKGILFTNDKTKGEVLIELLNQIKLLPSKIICIDDHLEYLTSVKEESKKAGIPFEGYHYTKEEILTF